MKKLIFFVTFFCPFYLLAQTDITFNYDFSGNQYVRELCLGGCFASKKAKSDVKKVADLKEEDLEKFSNDDNFSYYPNPVVQELYLRWERKEENLVSTIQVFNLNGQLLKKIDGIEKTNDLTLSFQDYPQGVYLVNLIHIKGDQKTIKIIKK